MGSAQSDALKRALEYLGAVEVAPGRYAAKLGERWHTFTESRLTERVRDGWRTHGNYQPMPSWWTPEQRFAWRVKGSNVRLVCADLNSAMKARENPLGGLERFAHNYYEHITASLETGAEILCG